MNLTMLTFVMLFPGISLIAVSVADQGVTRANGLFVANQNSTAG